MLLLTKCIGAQKLLDCRGQRMTPLAQRARRLPLGKESRQRVHPRRQRGERFRIASGVARLGQQAEHKFIATAGGNTKQQTIESGAPARLLIGGQAERGARIGVVAPAHIGACRERLQCVDIGGRQRCRLPNERMREHAENFTARQASTFECNEPSERVGGRQRASHGSIGNPEWNAERIVTRDAEHRIDQRRPLGGVGHEQEHIVRSQGRIVAQRGEQLVAQDFQLPHRAMRVVNAKRCVGSVDRQWRIARMHRGEFALQRWQHSCTGGNFGVERAESGTKR